MFRIVMLLLGLETVRRAWLTLALAAFAWAALGAFLFADALDGESYFLDQALGTFLLIEGTLSFVSAMGGIGPSSRFRKARSLLAIVIALLIITPWYDSDIILAVLFGIAFLADGALRIAAARVLRFPGWRAGEISGWVRILVAVFLLQPWPTWYTGTVPFGLGMMMFLSGESLLRLALRVRTLPLEEAMRLLLGRGNPIIVLPTPRGSVAKLEDGGRLIVHVWTAAGTAVDPARRPVIDRYIAAVDAKGRISTGHAALELEPDLYLSLYSDKELDHSPSDFMKVLRATAENDVVGRYLPSHAFEVGEWCESTEQVVFTTYDGPRLRAFCERYKQDRVYNLTNRNCSTSVVHALEIALAGSLGRGGRFWPAFLRLMTYPELWAAARLRGVGESMTWTPGLALDYARCLHALVHGRHWLSWGRLWHLVGRRSSRSRAA